MKVLAVVATLGPHLHLPDPPYFPDVEAGLTDELTRHYSANVTAIRRSRLASPQTTGKAIGAALSKPGDVLLLTVHGSVHRFARDGKGWALSVPSSLGGRRRSMLLVDELIDSAFEAASGRPLLICLDAMPPQKPPEATHTSFVSDMASLVARRAPLTHAMLVSALSHDSPTQATVRHGLWQALAAATAQSGDEGVDIVSAATEAAASAQRHGATVYWAGGGTTRLVPTLPSSIRLDLFSSDETSRIDAAVELARMAAAGDSTATAELGFLSAHDRSAVVRDYADLQMHPASQPSLPELLEAGTVPESVCQAAGEGLFLPGLLRHPGGAVPIGVDAPHGQPADRPRHTVRIAPFHLGRTPVTNREYLAYVIATDAHCPDHWASEADLWDEGSDRPVVNVSLHDAQRYCDWLTGYLHRVGRLADGARIVLPSETEWESAAGNARGDHHPWGSHPDPARANIRASGFGRPTPVGTFAPGGNNVFGCEDLIGNVWEWTRSAWGPSIRAGHHYPYDRDDGRENPSLRETRHVVRGGGFYYATECANSFTRNQMPQESRHPGGGFRVAAQVVEEVDGP